MTSLRHFHDWKIPALAAAVDILVRPWLTNGHRGPLDLRGCRIVVPTRHAGRRLRAELARITAENGSAVLSGSIVTPEFLIPTPPEAADDAVVLALLAKLLLAWQDRLPALFPAPDAPWDFAFALGLAAQLQDVRRELCAGDRRAADLLPLVPEAERPRWAEFAQLEQALVQEVSRLGKTEPLAALREAARHPPIAPYSRIIALFVPDFSALAIRHLQAAAQAGAVEIHVLAPASQTAGFDDWGRPRPEYWENEPLPLKEHQIHVFEQATDETKALAELLTDADHRRRALAVCTPDPDHARALGRRLEIDGLPLYLPNGIPLAQTAPGRLLDAWLALRRRGNYATTAALLREPDVQEWLGSKPGLKDTSALLSQLDACQTDHLPASFDELRHFARPGHETGDGGRYPLLAAALEELNPRLKEPPAVFLADLLDAARNGAGTARPPDPLAAEAAPELADLIRRTDVAARQAALAAADADELLSAMLTREQVFPRPNSSTARETIGWLETQWETAPAVVLADMREGVVPETRIGDAFLPDTLRVCAGLASNRDRLVRDLFLARALLESRPPDGVRFLFSRRAANQDPQIPSRLLLACPPAELPARVTLLFDRPAISAQAPAAAPLPVLPLRPPACRPEWIPATLSATAFKDYLTCPFRFYLRHILGMQTEDDRAREIDPGSYGELAHAALRVLHRYPALADEHQIRELLLDEMDRLARSRYGSRPPFAATVQLDSLRQRLGAAARVQAATVQAGWRVVATEEKFEADLDGLRVRARLDRVDRHLETGAIRILDYKTAETGAEPLKTHFRPKSAERWADLQLPLYRYVYEARHPPVTGAPETTAGYFNLPKAVAQTDIAILPWKTKAGENLYASALAKAREVGAHIRAGRFWPPADKTLPFDDFEVLFSGGHEYVLEPGAP